MMLPLLLQFSWLFFPLLILLVEGSSLTKEEVAPPSSAYSSTREEDYRPEFLVRNAEGHSFDHHHQQQQQQQQRRIQDQFFNATAECFSTFDENNPNRYCTFEDTPREGTFLLVSCPDSRGEDLSQCECSIGVGRPADAPNTPTCRECSFCRDGTLLYSCENVASGTCIGRTCGDECIASMEYTGSGAAAYSSFRIHNNRAASVAVSLTGIVFLSRVCWL